MSICFGVKFAACAALTPILCCFKNRSWPGVSGGSAETMGRSGLLVAGDFLGGIGSTMGEMIGVVEGL